MDNKRRSRGGKGEVTKIKEEGKEEEWRQYNWSRAFPIEIKLSYTTRQAQYYKPKTDAGIIYTRRGYESKFAVTYLRAPYATLETGYI